MCSAPKCRDQEVGAGYSFAAYWRVLLDWGCSSQLLCWQSPNATLGGPARSGSLPSVNSYFPFFDWRTGEPVMTIGNVGVIISEARYPAASLHRR